MREGEWGDEEEEARVGAVRAGKGISRRSHAA